MCGYHHAIDNDFIHLPNIKRNKMKVTLQKADEMTPLYEMVERIAPDKVAKNKHWREKVRQSLQIIRKKKASEQIIQLN